MKWLFIGLVVGLVLGSIGVLLLQHQPSQEVKYVDNTPGPSVVFERVKEQSELVGASQDYCIVDKVRDANKLFEWEIPWTENSFWYRYQGTLKVGINLADAEFEQDGNTLYVTLSAPYIISNTPDMEKSGALEERNNILNPIHIEDVDAFQRDCIARSAEEATKGSLMEDARESVRDRIRSMFAAAYGDAYEIKFSEKQPPQEQQ